MENEGWNYKHARSDGRNVFIFRDTDHASPRIQDKLLGAMELAISKRQFDLLFCEGGEGPFIPLYDPEITAEILRHKLIYHYQYNAIDLLAHKLKRAGNLEVKLHGVDSEQLNLKHVNCAQNIVQIFNAIRAPNRPLISAPIKVANLFFNLAYSEFLGHRRTLYSVNTMVRLMEENKVDSSGVIYGDGHFRLLAYALRRQGFGYVSYYPGETETGGEFAQYYIESLTKK